MSWWAGRTDTDVVHVLPNWDRGAHWLDEYCPCLPAKHWHHQSNMADGGGYIVSHNSWDGREAREAAPKDSMGGTIDGWSALHGTFTGNREDDGSRDRNHAQDA